MDDDERQTLDTALLQYQRTQTDIRGHDICNFLLLNSNVEELSEYSKTQTLRSRMQELSQYMSTERHHLGHDILMPSREVSPDLYDEEVDKLRKELHLDNALDMAFSPKKSSATATSQYAFHKNGKTRAKDLDIDLTPLREMENKDCSDDDEMPSGLPSKPLPLQQRISVAKFRAIMIQSQKSYDHEAIIDEIKDESGKYIPLSRIKNYTKKMQTMRGVSPADILDEWSLCRECQTRWAQRRWAEMWKYLVYGRLRPTDF